MFKRLVVVVAVIVMLTMAIVGCTGTGTVKKDDVAADKTDTKTETDATEKIEDTSLKGNIEVFLWCPDYVEQAQQQVDEFCKAYPDIDVLFTPMAGNTPKEVLQVRVSSNSLPDVISTNADTYGSQLADEDYLMDIGDTELWDRQLDVMKIAWTSGKKKIRYGISGGMAASFLYTNNDLLNDLGINPEIENWQEFLAACEKVKNAGKIPVIMCGSHVTTLSNTFGTYMLADAVTRGVKDYMSLTRAGKLDYNTPEFIAAINKLKILADKGYFQEGYMGTDYMDSVQQFQQGNAAFYFQGSWLAGQLVTSDFNVGITWAPWQDEGKTKVPVMSSETGWSISSKTKYKDASYKFLEFINTGKGYEIYQHTRKNIPAFKSETIDIEIDLPEQVKKALEKANEYPEQGMLQLAYMSSAARSETSKALQQMLAGDMTPEDVAKKIDEVEKSEAAKNN